MKPVKKVKIKLLRIEKLMIGLLVMLILCIPVVTIFGKALLSSSNVEVEKLRKKITKQSSVNQSLTMQINELASLTNIQSIAKEFGLSYNNDNILVIKED